MGRAHLIAALALSLAALGGLAAPSRTAAQTAAELHEERVVGATITSGLAAALATWPLLVPWEGFWRNEPDPSSGWAIAGALAAGGALSAATWALAQGHPTRSEILQTSGVIGLGVGLFVAALGALYGTVGDYDRLAFSLVFGLPALGTLAIGLIVSLVHLADQGDRAPSSAPEPTPLLVTVPLPVSL